MVPEEPEKTYINAKKLVGHNQWASESEEQVEELRPILAYVMQGKAQHACEVINQNVLQQLLNNSTQILQDLSLTGDYIEIK